MVNSGIRRGGITRYVGSLAGGGGGGVATATSLAPLGFSVGEAAGRDVDPVEATASDVEFGAGFELVAAVRGAVAVTEGCPVEEDADELGETDVVVTGSLFVTGVEADDAAAIGLVGAGFGHCALATTGAAGCSTGGAGTAVFARYLSQSESIPPTSRYCCRAY